MHEQSSVRGSKNGRDLREGPQPSEGRIQMMHENFPASRLISLVKLESGLDVGVGGEKKDQLPHDPDFGARSRSRMASQVVTWLGSR